jgi:molybdate transport repressor ModE-like protein
MTIRLTARWETGETELDARVIPLLRAVAREGSLNRAVSVLHLSYRHAWGLLGEMERVLGQTLVVMERGRGARLSPFAEQLLEADAAAASILNRELAPTLLALNREAAPRSARFAKPLLIHASHDFALAELKALLSDSRTAAIELHFRGSIDSLASLARRECDLAGFHAPENTADGPGLVPYRRWLGARDLRLVRFVTRLQGLMVRRGNPKRLRSIADLAARHVRFVNRQPESGTRLCFDRLLSLANLRPAQINGYEVEEFTHAAVAATVASGMADVGFGIEAAARRGGLDFIPLVSERYFLAARAATLAQPPARALIGEMKGPAFMQRLESLPGYKADGTGEIISVREGLRAT